MKNLVAKLNIGWVCMVILSLVVVNLGDAEIDPGICVAMWLLDEGEGNITEDDSGNGHDGQIPDGIDWVEGKFGEALLFPGTIPHFVTVPHEESLNLETWSITAWIKVDSETTGYWQAVVGKSTVGDIRNYAMQIHQNSGVLGSHFTEGGAGQYKFARGTTGLYDGEWHHIAGTYDKKMLRAYVDGVLEKEAAFSNTPDTHDAPFLIGSNTTAWEPFKGVIDEVGLFSMGLTEEDVIRIMEKGLSIALGITAVSPSEKLVSTWSAIKTGN